MAFAVSSTTEVMTAFRAERNEGANLRHLARQSTGEDDATMTPIKPSSKGLDDGASSSRRSDFAPQEKKQTDARRVVDIGVPRKCDDETMVFLARGSSCCILRTSDEDVDEANGEGPPSGLRRTSSEASSGEDENENVVFDSPFLVCHARLKLEGAVITNALWFPTTPAVNTAASKPITVKMLLLTSEGDLLMFEWNSSSRSCEYHTISVGAEVASMAPLRRAPPTSISFLIVLGTSRGRLVLYDAIAFRVIYEVKVTDSPISRITSHPEGAWFGIVSRGAAFVYFFNERAKTLVETRVEESNGGTATSVASPNGRRDSFHAHATDFASCLTFASSTRPSAAYLFVGDGGRPRVRHYFLEHNESEVSLSVRPLREMVAVPTSRTEEETSFGGIAHLETACGGRALLASCWGAREPLIWCADTGCCLVCPPPLASLVHNGAPWGEGGSPRPSPRGSPTLFSPPPPPPRSRSVSPRPPVSGFREAGESVIPPWGGGVTAAVPLDSAPAALFVCSGSVRFHRQSLVRLALNHSLLKNDPRTRSTLLGGDFFAVRRDFARVRGTLASSSSATPATGASSSSSAPHVDPTGFYVPRHRHRTLARNSTRERTATEEVLFDEYVRIPFPSAYAMGGVGGGGLHFAINAHVAVLAGERGFTVYSFAARRWKLFRSSAEEDAVRVAGMALLPGFRYKLACLCHASSSLPSSVSGAQSDGSGTARGAFVWRIYDVGGFARGERLEKAPLVESRPISAIPSSVDFCRHGGDGDEENDSDERDDDGLRHHAPQRRARRESSPLQMVSLFPSGHVQLHRIWLGRGTAQAERLRAAREEGRVINLPPRPPPETEDEEPLTRTLSPSTDFREQPPQIELERSFPQLARMGEAGDYRLLCGLPNNSRQFFALNARGVVSLLDLERESTREECLRFEGGKRLAVGDVWTSREGGTLVAWVCVEGGAVALTVPSLDPEFESPLLPEPPLAEGRPMFGSRAAGASTGSLVLLDYCRPRATGAALVRCRALPALPSLLLFLARTGRESVARRALATLDDRTARRACLVDLLHSLYTTGALPPSRASQLLGSVPFEDSAAVVAACARQMDREHWDSLFSLIGESPHDLFVQCVRRFDAAKGGLEREDLLKTAGDLLPIADAAVVLGERGGVGEAVELAATERRANLLYSRVPRGGELAAQIVDYCAKREIRLDLNGVSRMGNDDAARGGESAEATSAMEVVKTISNLIIGTLFYDEEE